MEFIEDALKRGALAQPNRVLLVIGSRSWTYHAIWRSALRVAAWLSAQGISPGDRVLLQVSQRDAAFVMGYFGTHLAGAIAVPVDEKSADVTKTSIDAQVQPAVSMTPAMLAPFLDDDDSFAVHGDENGAAKREDVADIMFTSGTTGTPKGVALTHGGIAAAAASINAFIGNGADDKEVVTVPLSHSFGLGRLRCTVLAGGTLILVPGLTFPALVFNALAAHEATGLVCVPTGVAVLLKSGEQKLAGSARHLRYMEIGSAPMPAEAKRRLMSLLPRTRICMHYGLTEASRSAFIEFHADAAALDSVGRPSPNVEVAIYGEHGDRVPEGAVGRMKIRSPAVMKEYWRNPGLTSLTLDADGWLDTHDLGRIDERGYLYLEGRTDDVINVGGKKVYPASVENAAMQHADILEAACIGEPDPDGLLGEVTVLYAVARKNAVRSDGKGAGHSEAGTHRAGGWRGEGGSPLNGGWDGEAGSHRNGGGSGVDSEGLDTDELRTFLASRLDAHAVPRRIVFTDALPRTDSGKLQRAALRQISRRRNAADAADRPVAR